MKATDELTREELSDSILPSQYYEQVSRRVPICDGEHRLMWAVLEDAIRTYLANNGASNPARKKAFEEVRAWFGSPRDNRAGMFGFQSICEFLEIDSKRLLEGLESPQHPLPSRHHRGVRIGRVRNLAA